MACWREREAIEQLLFKLEEEQLLLLAGRSWWLGHATREVEELLDRICEVELARAVEVAAVAGELDLGEDASLAMLAGAAPPPWGPLLDGHDRALRSLKGQVVAVAEANLKILREGYRAVDGALSERDGQGDAAELLLEVVNYRAALRANARVLRPALVEAAARE